MASMLFGFACAFEWNVAIISVHRQVALFSAFNPAKMQRAYTSELRTTVEKLAEKISKGECDMDFRV